MYDGQGVTYAGSPRELLSPGDEGKILAISPTYAHVKWATGAARNQVTICDPDDLVSSARRDEVTASLDDSLEFGGVTVTSAVEDFEEDGALGVVASLSERGYLAPMSDAADEAIALVSARVRQDQGVRQVLAGLDDDSGELVIRQAAAVILREALQDD